MDPRGCLSVLLGCLSVISWLVPLTGEEVSLICTPPEGQKATRFFFHEKKAGGAWDVYASEANPSLIITRMPLETHKTFACSFMGESRDGELFQSALSNEVVLSIAGTPPAPTLSQDPEYPVYVQGERVTLFCSAPEGWNATGYTFYQVQKSWRPRQLPGNGMQPYQKIIVSENTVGEYSCEYSSHLSGQEMVSTRSNLTSVAMTGRLHEPRVSVSPKRDVYVTGESVKLTCSAPENRLVSEIQFFKDRRSLLILHLSSRLVPFNISHSLRLLPQDGGKYSCLYHIVESGRKIASPESNFISLSVIDISRTVQTTLTSESTKRPTSSPRIWQSGPSQLPATTNQVMTTGKRHHAQIPGSTASTPSPSLSRAPYNTPTSTSSKTTIGSEITSTLLPGSASQPTGPKDGPSRPLWILIRCCASGGGLLLLTVLMFLICLHRRRCKENNRITARSYWKSVEFQLSTKRKRSKDSIGISIREKKPEQFCPVDENWGILPKRITPKSKRGVPSKAKEDENRNSRAQFKFPDVDPTYTLLGFSSSTFAQEENRSTKEETHIYSEHLL